MTYVKLKHIASLWAKLYETIFELDYLLVACLVATNI